MNSCMVLQYHPIYNLAIIVRRCADDPIFMITLQNNNESLKKKKLAKEEKYAPLTPHSFNSHSRRQTI